MNILAKLKFRLANKLILLSLLTTGILSLILALKTEPVKINLEKVNIQQPSSKPKLIEISPTPVVKRLSPKIYSSPKPSLTPSPTIQVTSQPTPTPVIDTNQINVSINGHSTFIVSVNKTADQCDVLTKALQDGKITSLNMRYENAYKTYAVYQINGIGQETQVWWTYAVNGKNPPLGCSLVKTNNNDKVIWTYTGSN